MLYIDRDPLELGDVIELLVTAHVHDQYDICGPLLMACNKLAEEQDEEEEREGKFYHGDREAWPVYMNQARRIWKKAVPERVITDEDMGSGDVPFTSYGDISNDWADGANWHDRVLRRFCNEVVGRDLARARYMQRMFLAEQKNKELEKKLTK